MEFSIITLFDQKQSEDWLPEHFHPDGLKCPLCGASVADAEIRTLLDYALLYGRLPDDWRKQIAKYIQDKQEKMDAEEEQPSPPVDEVDDDDIPPRQLGLWDKEE